MPFSYHFKVLAVLLAGLVSFPLAAAGKIRFAIGDERKIIDTKGKETDAKTGGKVREKDKIRTGIEAQVIVALPDGSIISVEENSLVEFTNLQSSNGVQSAQADVKQGKVRFDAQKQKGKSKLQFKTGTATAAIRGTDGIAGISTKGFSVFGLNSGNMDIKDDCGASGSINAGELMIVHGGKCNLQKIQTPNAGDGNVVDKVMAAVDEANGEIDNATLQKLLNELNGLVETLKKQKATEAGCKVAPLPDMISTSKVDLKVTCSHAPKSIFVNGILAGENAATVEKTVDWEPTFIGEKKFEFTCIDTLDVAAEAAKLKIPANLVPQNMKKAVLQFACGEAHTYYYNAAIDSANKAVAQDTSAPANVLEIEANTEEICTNGSITINGLLPELAIDSLQTISIDIVTGKRTFHIGLPASERQFSQIVPIKDASMNWNAKSIDVTATYPDGMMAKASLPISVNKACKSVNTARPTVTIQPAITNLKCEATYKVGGNEDDFGIVSIYRDHELVAERTVNGNEGGSFKLSKGKYTYKVVVTDQAKNQTSASKALACYDNNATAFVTINGKRGHSKMAPKRQPKGPPDFDNVSHETLRIKINKLSRNDLSQVESITVTQDGKVGYLLNLSNTNGSIDEHEYTLPVDVEYMAKTTFRVKVKLYNGRILESSVTYNEPNGEVR